VEVSRRYNSRQTRIFIGAFIWLYSDTVNKTSLSSRIAAMQTLATEEGKQMVLSVTQSDGTKLNWGVFRERF
jgi:hypothetical protein